MAAVTIYHNPRCSKSRQTLELLHERGIDPEIIEYLESPPDEETLGNLLEKLGLAPGDLLRTKEDEYRELRYGRQKGRPRDADSRHGGKSHTHRAPHRGKGRTGAPGPSPRTGAGDSLGYFPLTFDIIKYVQFRPINSKEIPRFPFAPFHYQIYLYTLDGDLLDFVRCALDRPIFFACCRCFFCGWSSGAVFLVCRCGLAAGAQI